VTRSQTPPKQMAKKLFRLLRVERPDYQYLKKVFQHTRSILAISPAKMQKRLPELLTDHELVGFYEAVWHARNPTHMIMIKAPDLYGVAKRGVGACAAPRCGPGSLSAACRAGQEQQGPKRPVSEQFQGRTWAIYPWTSRAPGRVLIRIEPTTAVLDSSRPTDRPPIRRGCWDRKTGLSASFSASDHHFSDPQRNHQPKTATAQRSRGGEKSGDLSGFGSGRCFC
jgi:hypothetical protein